MTAHLIGEQDVEILGVVGANQLAVRPLSFLPHYDRLQKQLEEVSQELKKLSRPNVNQSCAVLHENRWHRGLVEVIERLTCRVRLVDLGRRRNVKVDELRELPDHLCWRFYLGLSISPKLTLPPWPGLAKVQRKRLVLYQFIANQVKELVS